MEPVSPRLSRERLLDIVAHLRKPQSELSLDRFNFCNVADESCGTNGCAMGEYPAIWPNDFRYVRRDDTTLYGVKKIDNNAEVYNINAAWLGITDEAEEALFYPSCPDEDDDDDWVPEDLADAGVRKLPYNASKDEVADNIQAYVDGFLAPDMLDDDE